MSKLRNASHGTLLTTFVAPFALRKMQTDGLYYEWMEQEIGLLEALGRQASMRLPALGALHYKWVTKLTNRYAELGYPVHIVVYEDLVSTPEPTITNLCSFLGVDFEPAMLEHEKHDHHPNTVPNSQRLIGNNDPFRAIHSASIGKGREVLTPEQIEVIERIMAV